jgi:hypothetical protein
VSGGNWPLKLGRRIDYILVRCDEKRLALRIRDCRRLFDIPSTASGPAIIFGLTANLAPTNADEHRGS